MRNEIFIHTDKGSYVGGEVIYGTVFLQVNKQINSKGMIIEIVGYEKAEWEYNQTESYEENGQQMTRQIVKEHKDSHDFFKDSFRLIDYPGGFPLGQFSYPFQYRLPDSLPGVFSKKRKNGLKMKCKVEYKIKCIVEIPGFFTHDLKCKQHLVVHEKLSKLIEAKHIIKEQTVRTLCCIPRGPVKCESWIDKNCYVSGETAQGYVKVNNDSAVNVNHFNVKLIREITLKAHGHVNTFRDIVSVAKYDGTPAHTFKESPIPLRLYGRKGHIIQPSTNANLVKCRYDIMIEIDIPWAPDLEVFVPVTIYAPQNQLWAQWAPPAWASQAQVQQVNAQLAVPPQLLAQAQMGFVHQSPPQVPYSGSMPTSPVVTNAYASPNVSMERRPLLG